MIRLFLRKLFADRAVWLLPVAGFGLTSGIGLMVFGGAMYFYTLPAAELGGVYALYATVALILLVVPMLALMSSAARLLARRRDERLSGLRLLGASSGQLRRLVIVEAGVLAAACIGCGALLYAALLPVVGLLPFAGQPMGAGGLWLGPGLLSAAMAALLVFAAAAAFAGLRRVEVTPLGVRTRTSAQQVWRGRAVLAAGAVVVGLGVYFYAPQPDMATAIVVSFVLLILPLLAVQLIGPWVLKVITRLQARRARTPEKLIAARNVLESPQQMWRQVGGVAVAAFVGVLAGCGMGLASTADPQYMSPQDVLLTDDIQRGILLTLLVAFLLTACSVGLNQTAQILDRRELYAGLAKLGFSLSQLHRIRRLSVTRSLGAVLLVAVSCAAVVAFPVVGWAIVAAPESVATVVAVLAAGVGLVHLGTLSTRPTMRAVTLRA
ncbi:hypothetical protein GCM10023354_13800 [Garicola koreensis]|uniref:permease n=1 Tax=Garicola koreensis TaxID=1262554 RepID=UPI0031EDBBA9